MESTWTRAFKFAIAFLVVFVGGCVALEFSARVAGFG